MKAALRLHPTDTVATLLESVQGGESVTLIDMENHPLGVQTAQEAIDQGHKIALCAMQVGDDVIKYGYSIGVASAAISPGDRVHTHNLDSRRGRGDLV